MTSTAALAAIARLDVFSSQRSFRALLDALSRPGRTARLHAPSGTPAALVPALTLADVDVTVAVVADHDDADWHEVVSIATGARAVDLERADIVVALRPPTPDEVRSLRRGRADAPEEGAVLSLACSALGTGTGAVHLGLRGPGVPDRRTIDVGGVVADVFDALVSANRNFPMGVDTYLVAADGQVVGIPRSTNMEVR